MNNNIELSEDLICLSEFLSIRYPSVSTEDLQDAVIYAFESSAFDQNRFTDRLRSLGYSRLEPVSYA